MPKSDVNKHSLFKTNQINIGSIYMNMVHTILGHKYNTSLTYPAKMAWKKYEISYIWSYNFFLSRGLIIKFLIVVFHSAVVCEENPIPYFSSQFTKLGMISVTITSTHPKKIYSQNIMFTYES